MSEETLARVLERHAGDVHPRHLALDDVRTTARRIRRRRRLTASGAAAAVMAAAITVPALVSGPGGHHGAPDPAPSPPPAPSGVAYLHDGTVTLPDGHSIALDLHAAQVTQLGVLTDGRIVLATANPQAVQVFSPATGARLASYPVDVNAITMSPDDRLVAWVDGSFQIQVLESDATEPVQLPGIPLPGETPATIDYVDGSVCRTGGSGCMVWGGDGTTTTSISTSQGVEELSTSLDLRITDTDAGHGLWAVSLRPGDGGQYGCSGIYDLAKRRLVHKVCGTSGLQFAPDHEHLLGMRIENGSTDHVDVLGRQLQQEFVYEPPAGAVVTDAAWADASHLLVVTAGPRWSLLRVPIDGGSPETVAGPVDGPNPESSSAFVLSD